MTLSTSRKKEIAYLGILLIHVKAENRLTGRRQKRKERTEPTRQTDEEQKSSMDEDENQHRKNGQMETLPRENLKKLTQFQHKASTPRSYKNINNQKV